MGLEKRAHNPSRKAGARDHQTDQPRPGADILKEEKS